MTGSVGRTRQKLSSCISSPHLHWYTEASVRTAEPLFILPDWSGSLHAKCTSYLMWLTGSHFPDQGLNLGPLHWLHNVTTDCQEFYKGFFDLCATLTMVAHQESLGQLFLFHLYIFIHSFILILFIDIQLDLHAYFHMQQVTQLYIQIFSFYIVSHYGLSQDIEHSSFPCYTVGPCCLNKGQLLKFLMPKLKTRPIK